MLNKGLRDQESERIDNVLNTLHSLVFVPKFWNIDDTSQIDNALTDFGLTTQILIEINQNDLIELLGRLHLDWQQQEQFADFMMALSIENPFDLTEKAMAIYEHIQSESKVFSFGINTKIASAKANL